MTDEAATVLITGSSTGFGREAAERLARRGHRVFATMRDPDGRNSTHRDALQSLAKEGGLWLRVLELDVTSDDSVQRAVDAVLAEAGQIDTVVNNAGIVALGVAEGYTPEQFARVFDVNVLGAVRVNRAVLPSMRARRSGLLIQISSGAGRVVVPAMAPYTASKFAVEAIADVMRYELRPFGIDSILVEPGIYRTPILDRNTTPADSDRVASYGAQSNYATRVLDTFLGAMNAPGAPGGEEVADALVRLIEARPSDRPFRTVLPEAIAQLLSELNAAAESLRPAVAQMFNVPELCESHGGTASTNDGNRGTTIKVSALYPDGPGARFDLGYYRDRHMPMVIERCAGAVRRTEIEQGLAGAEPASRAPFCAAGHLFFDSAESMQASFAKHLAEFAADLPNFTNIQPTLQISEVVA